MAHDVFDHHHRAIRYHAKIQRTQRQEICGNVSYVQANRRKQKRERNRRRDDQGSTDIAEEQKEDDRNQDHPFRQVVKHGVAGEVNEIAAVDEWNNLHARRQNMIVQFVHFFMDALQSRVCHSAFAQEHDAGHDIVVIDDLSVFPVNRLSGLAESNLGTLRHDRNILHPQRRAIFCQDDCLRDVLGAVDQSDGAHVDLLQPLFYEASSCIGVIGGELLLDLRQAQAVGDQLVRIRPNLIFAGGTTEAGDVDNVRNGFEILFDDPVLNRLQFHRVICRISAVQGEEIDLADGTPVRAHLRHYPRRQGDLAQPFENPLAVPVIIRFVVENKLHVRESKKRERTQMHDVRDAVHHDFERNRDLLLDLFRRNPRPLSDDLDIVVGYIGIRLNGKVTEGNDAPSEKQQGEPQNKQAVAESKINDSTNHLLLHGVLQCQSIRDHLDSGFEPGNNFLHIVGKHDSRDHFQPFEMPRAYRGVDPLAIM